MPGEGVRVLLIGRHELAHGLARDLAARGTPLALLPAAREDARRPGLGNLDLATATRFEAGADVAACAATFEADLVLSAGFDRILTAATLDRIPLAANVHFGALPRYRGNLSIPWALINGEREVGVSLHAIAPGIDDGAILDRRLLPVADTDAASDVYAAAVAAGRELAVSYVAALEAGTAPAGTPQDERAATYYPPPFPGGFEIAWRQSLRHVLNYIRACHFPPYPGAHARIAGHTLEFAWPVAALEGDPGRAAGAVQGGRVAVLNGEIVPGAVRCGEKRWPRFADAVADLGLDGARFEPAAHAGAFGA